MYDLEHLLGMAGILEHDELFLTFIIDESESLQLKHILIRKHPFNSRNRY